MSTWTSSAALAAVVALAGCMQGGEFASRAAPETLAVAGADVVIGGPPGYCVDRAASRDQGDAAFVLLGSCASIVQDARAAAPGLPGLLTASVAEPAPEGEGLAALEPAAMERFFRSPPGLAALARNGDPGSVKVLETRVRRGAFYLHVGTVGDTTMEGMAPDYWRGLVDLNGHLVTVTAQAFADQPWSDETGFRTVTAFVERIRAETAARAVPEPSAESGQTDPEPGGLFARLLR